MLTSWLSRRKLISPTRGRTEGSAIDWLFITNSPTGGGAERSINTSVRVMQSLGLNVGIICINESESDAIKVDKNLFLLNRKRFDGTLKTFKKGLEFRKLVRQINPKILVLNCDLPEFFGALFIKNYKIVCVEHVSKPWANRRFLGFLIRLILYFKKTSWIVVNDYLELWPNFLIGKVKINNPIANISELESIKPKSTVSNIKRLVYVGRLAEPQKRTSWVIKIASQISLPCLIVGSGDSMSDLLLLSENSSCNVEFVGHSQNPWQHLKPGDLLIVPSAWEGDGLVLIEAIIAGIPILISDIPEFRYFNLDDFFYAKTAQDFVNKIKFNMNSLQNFQINETRRNQLIEERLPQKIAFEWVNYLSRI